MKRVAAQSSRRLSWSSASSQSTLVRLWYCSLSSCVAWPAESAPCSYFFMSLFYTVFRALLTICVSSRFEGRRLSCVLNAVMLLCCYAAPAVFVLVPFRLHLRLSSLPRCGWPSCFSPPHLVVTHTHTYTHTRFHPFSVVLQRCDHSCTRTSS